ncbi:tetratricopeptide repeat protein 39B-like protein, partial [Leptotrombidium deliense]
MSLVRGHVHVNELFDLFYENKFEEAYSQCDKFSSFSMIHAHGKAFLSFLYALLTLEKEYIEKGVKDLEESLNFASKHRKSKSIVESVTSFWWKPDASKYTDEELHAELIYAECNIMLGLLTFFGDQSILSLLKGAIKMTTANSGL